MSGSGLRVFASGRQVAEPDDATVRRPDDLTLEVSPAAVHQAGLPSGPRAWIAEEGAFSDDATSSERGRARATARPAQSIYLYSEGLTLTAPGNTTPL
jgi:hypothetical protein